MSDYVRVRRELLEDILSTLDYEGATSWTEALRTALAAPVVEPATCAQCKASTTDICNQNGCGYLESGNGAPVVERQPVLFVAVDLIEDPECVGMHATRHANELQHVPLYTSSSAPVALKDHEFRELVNRLRDITCEYVGSGQLRERISMELRACLDKVKEMNR